MVSMLGIDLALVTQQRRVLLLSPLASSFFLDQYFTLNSFDVNFMSRCIVISRMGARGQASGQGKRQ